MTQPENGSTRPRERSARYPGVDLGETLEFCRRIDQKGADGLAAAEIATALGYSNVRTNSFSARLSSARQFGLLEIREESYHLTHRARAILHPVDAQAVVRLRREAFLEPPLYASLATRLADRRLPEPEILANLLYHQEQITAAAKQAAATAFLESARLAGVIDAEGTFRPHDTPEPAGPARKPAVRTAPTRRSPVRIDLRLWGPDAGKIVRIRAPESMTAASFERLLAVLRLHVRVEDTGPDPL